MKKVIFLDIDGTLILPTGQVSERVKNAIKEARKNGHYVFLCTGRSKVGVNQLLPIGFDGVICSAGGYIEINGKKVYESCLDEDDLKMAREVFARHHIMYNLETNYKTFQDEEVSKYFVSQQNQNKQHMNSEMARLLNEMKEMFNVCDIQEFDKNPIPVQKLCFIAKSEKDLEEPRKLLSDKYNFIIHEMFSKDVINGEIIIRDTNKGKAVEFVMDKLGIDMKDSIGFGDSMNDYEMIHACAYSVVMENGSSELKPYATTICESVEDDGVYHEFVRLGLCNR